MTFSRYPDNWSEIALRIKQKQDWKWIKCGRRCLHPGEDRSKLSKSETMARTLQVHHANYIPEDNRPENLIALCTGCHLSFHNRSQGNVVIGQLSLFE